jgi:hypothetical protein
MHAQTVELQQRTRRFSAAVAQLAERAANTASSKRLVRTLIAASQAVERGYRDSCASASPEQFISAISVVARNAKRAKSALVLLVQLDHLSIKDARDLIFEARGLEAIFIASRNTAKRRANARMVSRRNPSERAAPASDGKTSRRRRNPPGVT